MMASGIGTSSLGTAGLLASSGAQGATPIHANDVLRMPDESEPHSRTWMGFGASEAIWGKTLLPVVRRNLALIANAIAKYEPVSMLVRSNEMDIAKGLMGKDVTLVEASLDDFWLRDTGPVFVMNQNKVKAGIKFNFNGWGSKQNHAADANVANRVISAANVNLVKTNLVLEGGGIEVDGQGTAIITESCVLNPNRNPGLSKASCEAELKRLLGIEKVIWLPGVVGVDITDGHTDFYARFAHPGVVVAAMDNDPASSDYALTRQHLAILKNSTDAKGRKLQISTLAAPSHVRKTYDGEELFSAGYVNFYVCNGAVIMPQFGDAAADAAARSYASRFVSWQSHRTTQHRRRGRRWRRHSLRHAAGATRLRTGRYDETRNHHLQHHPNRNRQIHL